MFISCLNSFLEKYKFMFSVNEAISCYYLLVDEDFLKFQISHFCSRQKYNQNCLYDIVIETVQNVEFIEVFNNLQKEYFSLPNDMEHVAKVVHLMGQVSVLLLNIINHLYRYLHQPCKILLYGKCA